MKKTIQLFIYIMAAGMISACGSPESYFEDAIKKEGYIPYATPMASAGVGTIVQGGPEAMGIITRPEKCFPNYMGPNVPTGLRWTTDTDLPSSYESFQLGFGVDLNGIMAAGNPLANINLSYNKAKTVQIEFSGASIEFMDQAALYYYYFTQMEEVCHEFLKDSPFISQALRIEKMKFTFYNSSGVSIGLSQGMIGSIMNIGAGVNWKIENRQSLIIDTPKYIGYQVGFMDESRPGRIGWYAYKTKKGEFDFKQVGSSVPVPDSGRSGDQYMR
ncbi:MAG: hypothetical protein KDD40_08285 [Bdellovibrionales bacterium]|nr:hypothetical protein [Bdellovibrionales bacterium]